MKNEQRRALRILVDIPIVVESIGQPPLSLHPNLENIYQRVNATSDRRGEQVIGALRDLSTNGAFIHGEPLPLLSRVAMRFSLEDVGPVEAVGWILWRRTDDCEIPRDNHAPVVLRRGFGVLFEAIPLEARFAIHRMVTQAFRSV
ncbi:MAG TPA: PilZ domain-containing protein [Kofleriaceae bacterium]|nr:PilZ domain-containing protein [Kofleriaceae bacterium]